MTHEELCGVHVKVAGLAAIVLSAAVIFGLCSGGSDDNTADAVSTAAQYSTSATQLSPAPK